MLRREKRDVETQLAEKIERVIRLQVSRFLFFFFEVILLDDSCAKINV